MGSCQHEGALGNTLMSTWEEVAFGNEIARHWRALFCTASRSASYECVVRVYGGLVAVRDGTLRFLSQEVNRVIHSKRFGNGVEDGGASTTQLQKQVPGGRSATAVACVAWHRITKLLEGG